MGNVIIVLIIAVAFIAAIIPTVKHFQRKGGCCGGGEVKHKKKRIGKVIDKKTFRVDGMHCRHCSARVEEVLNDIPEVKAKVSLKKGIVTVYYAKSIEDSEIRRRIEKAGYKVR